MIEITTVHINSDIYSHFFIFYNLLIKLWLNRGANIELFGDNIDALVGDERVVNKPVKVIRSNFNVITHDFPKPFIVGNDKQVYHYHITQLQPVNHLRNVHVTKGIQNHER